MAYETLATMIESHTKDIARQMADTIIARKIPSYAIFPVDQLAEMLTPTIEKIAHYIRVGDPIEYRDYFRQLIQTRMSNKFTSTDIIAVSQILNEILKSLVDTEFGDAAHERERAAFQRRLDGLQSLTLSTTVATRPLPPKADQ